MEPQTAHIRTKNVRRHTTPGAVNESRLSIITETHSLATGPFANDLEIPKTGL